jgi:hypothetical protein
MPEELRSSTREQEQGDASRKDRDDYTNLLSGILRVASGVVQHIRENPSLRKEVVQILRQLEQAITIPEAHEPHITAMGATDEVPVPTAESVQVETPEPSTVNVDTSTLRDLKTALASVSGFAATETTAHITRPARRAIGLDAIARSCRVKAEACEWAVERQKLIADPHVDFRMEVSPRDRALIEKARELEACFLWMGDEAQGQGAGSCWSPQGHQSRIHAIPGRLQSRQDQKSPSH